MLFRFPASIQIVVMVEKVVYCNLDKVIYSCFILLFNILISLICFHFLTAELPLEFPDGTTPVTCRVSIYDGSADKKVGVGSLMHKASAPPLLPGNPYMEEVLVKV